MDAMTKQEILLEKKRVITVQGRDKAGRPIVRIVGKNFPGKVAETRHTRQYVRVGLVTRAARELGGGGHAEAALKGYVRRRVTPAIGEAEFVVVYMHSGVDRRENFPGVGAVRTAYESMPAAVRERLHAVYFLHPGLQSRLFFSTLGRRLEYLWAHVRKGELDVPEAVRRHDDELEQRPLMDYGIEASERCGVFDAASMDTTASLHSLRCAS
uniref:CRAL-TRIO domain-containing protein n=1 Tax=Oryza glumipatula TaxID=40148 RepID=A0A0D9ZP70_9ORYZ